MTEQPHGRLQCESLGYKLRILLTGSFQCYALVLFKMWCVDSLASSGSLLEMQNCALPFSRWLRRLLRRSGDWESPKIQNCYNRTSELTFRTINTIQDEFGRPGGIWGLIPTPFLVCLYWEQQMRLFYEQRRASIALVKPPCSPRLGSILSFSLHLEYHVN